MDHVQKGDRPESGALHQCTGLQVGNPGLESKKAISPHFERSNVECPISIDPPQGDPHPLPLGSNLTDLGEERDLG